MTTKDLNLSLDKGLFNRRTGKGQQPHVRAVDAASRPSATQPAPPGRPAQPGHPASSRRQSRSGKAASGRRASRQLFAVCCIAVANMLFLLLAGIWLSGNTYYATASYVPAQAQAPAAAAISAGITTSLARINERLDTLELQLGKLQLSPDQQQRRQEPENSPVDEQLPEAAARNDDTPVADSGEPAVEPASAPAKAWHVNLGNFDNREAAAAIQHRVTAIGHRAEISAASVGGMTIYRLVLPGFSDRESAEFAANQIMSKTDLNGLWVGESN